jgi:hypothetical protein
MAVFCPVFPGLLTRIPASMNVRGRPANGMKVRITRQPVGIVQGMSLKYYRVGEVYELPPSLAEYLVMEQYALLEMRARDRPPVPVAVERRRQH